MPITPTSSISKNYQALGIDEIANDIETVFTSVNALETTVNALPAAPTTTVVNISSAQISAMGTTPIELLPVPAAGIYYDSAIVMLEFYPGNVNFTSGESNFTLNNGSNAYDLSILALKDGYEAYWVVDCNQVDRVTCAAEGFPARLSVFENYPNYASIYLFSLGAIADGNGTMKATITYTTRTFGA